MFTGIVQQLGAVADVEANDFGVALRVDSNSWTHRPSDGDSIAVNGCCLTVADVEGGTLRFDVIRQTLQTTTLGTLEVGAPVNLEHAVTPDTLMGGHVVQGHVDGVGVVRSVVKSAQEWRLRIEPPPALMEYVAEKGSIAVDGVSLTLAAVDATSFEVALIPTTLRRTTLGRRAEGDGVNLETDYVAKVVVNWLRRSGPRR